MIIILKLLSQRTNKYGNAPEYLAFKGIKELDLVSDSPPSIPPCKLHRTNSL